jgi:hypothetical protein
MGQATLATPQKGALVADEVADRLVEFAGLLRDLPDPERDDHHTTPPAGPLSA